LFFFPPNFVYRLRADDWLEFRKTACAPRQVGRAEKTITNTSRYERGDDARPAGPQKYCELVLTETKPIYCDIIVLSLLLYYLYTNGGGDGATAAAVTASAAAVVIVRHKPSTVENVCVRFFGFSIFATIAFRS